MGGAHLPVVAHGGEAIVSFETTAADALELTVDPPLEQAQGLEPGYAGDEGQTVRKNALAGAAPPGPQTARVTVLEGDDTLDACPPARPRFSVQDRVPYGIDRGVEMVQGGEMVLVTVGFAHAITTTQGVKNRSGNVTSVSTSAAVTAPRSSI